MGLINEDVNKIAFKYKGLTPYIKYVERNSKPTRRIVKGKLFSFNYKYGRNYRYDILSLFDKLPLSLVVTVSYSKQLFTAINLHLMPIKDRQLFIKKIRKNFGKNINRIGMISYARMLRLFPKIKRVTRQYHMYSVKSLRGISIDDVDHIIKFHANTYHNASYNKIVSAYYGYGK